MCESTPEQMRTECGCLFDVVHGSQTERLTCQHGQGSNSGLTECRVPVTILLVKQFTSASMQLILPALSYVFMNWARRTLHSAIRFVCRRLV